MDKVEQNIVICQKRAPKPKADNGKQIIIDLQDTHKSGYFAVTEVNICFII